MGAKKNMPPDDHRLTFGKYRGQTIAYIRSVNPGYLDWASKNVAGFKDGQHGTKPSELAHRRIIAKVITYSGEIKWYTE